MSSKLTAALFASVVLLGAIGTVTGVSTAPGADPATNSVETGPATSVVTASPTALTASGERATDESTTPASNASLGAEISGFLSANAAELDGHVESGMWLTSFERAGNLTLQQRALDRRTAVLDTRLTRIGIRSNDLFDGETNHSLTRRAHRAELAGELGALRDAIIEAQNTGASAGVDTTEIKALRTDASNLTLPPTVRVLERKSSTELDDG